jgi:phthalate 4,5-dioxygenase oxygenase subunit
MNKETSETLVRTGRDTPMGNLMRRYWVPILMSSEIAEPDGSQVRVQILGEKLLAFRDSEGRPGLIDEFCSHRGVSLYFGRNEENGIRCAYHGVKFDRNGKCVDVPSAPQSCARMDIKSYPCIERGGLLWAYMVPVESAIICRRWKAESIPPMFLMYIAMRSITTQCTRTPRRWITSRPTAM